MSQRSGHFGCDIQVCKEALSVKEPFTSVIPKKADQTKRAVEDRNLTLRSTIMVSIARTKIV